MRISFHVYRINFETIFKYLATLIRLSKILQKSTHKGLTKKIIYTLQIKITPLRFMSFKNPKMTLMKISSSFHKHSWLLWGKYKKDI